MSVAAPPQGHPATNHLLIGTFLMINPERPQSPKEIRTATGLSRYAVRLGLEAFLDARLLVKVSGNRNGTYRVQVTHYGVQQIVAWLAEHWTPERVVDMCVTPQGHAIVTAFLDSILFKAIR